MKKLDEIQGEIEVLKAFLESLGEVVDSLTQREQMLTVRERKLEAALVDVESILEDLQATEPESYYRDAKTYEVGDDLYVDPATLPARDLSVLTTLYDIALETEEGLVVSNVSNRDLVKLGSTQFDPLTVGSVSAALTRLNQRGVINTQALSGRGYPRRIFILARLEDYQ